MSPRVMTVSGPIPPDRVGFTLPHEHTGIYLWHVPDRWDYWELTPDELVLADELADFRRRGGSTLVDMTGPGVGRDPERLRRLATRSGDPDRDGLRLVPRRLLPRRGAHRPPIGR